MSTGQDPNWVSKTIAPKSDQLNADDLLTGPIQVSIEDVTECASVDQPVSISISGGYKPWKPCKTMRRVLIALWGETAGKWVGRQIVLVNDPSVKWAGVAVGGIRIASMSDIEAPIQMMITMTRGQRKPISIDKIEVAPKDPSFLESWKTRFKEAASTSAVNLAAKSIATAYMEKDLQSLVSLSWVDLEQTEPPEAVTLLKDFTSEAYAKLSAAIE